MVLAINSLKYETASLYLSETLIAAIAVDGGMGVLFYYAIIDEVMDETDDTLENYSEILINNALMDPSILDTEGTLMSFYKFRPISEEEAEDYDERVL